MIALRASDSWPSTLRREISQGSARRRAGYLCVDEKEKSASHANDAKLNRGIVLATLSKTLSVTEWQEVRGPDSMQLR
jgi:hypothetical protein